MLASMPLSRAKETKEGSRRGSSVRSLKASSASHGMKTCAGRIASPRGEFFVARARAVRKSGTEGDGSDELRGVTGYAPPGREQDLAPLQVDVLVHPQHEQDLLGQQQPH